MRHQLDGTSWVNREVHAQICGGRRGKFPPPTRQILSTLISTDGGQARVAGHDVSAEPDAVRAAIGVTG